MMLTIHVDLESPGETADLVEFLGDRGLTAAATSFEDHCELEVGYALDPEARLQRDFEEALSSWLEQHGRPLIPVSDAEHHYVLRPPFD